MFKTLAFACASLALVSAQGSLTALATEANAALAPVLGQQNPVVQSGDSLSLNVNDYEWTLTEQGGEYNLNVEQLASNANNLAPALAALLANAGAASQANNEAADNILNAEAANVGVDVESGVAAAAANQYGAQLSESSGAITQLAEQQYQEVAAALASNSNGLADQVNAQINEAANNQEGLSGAVSSAIDAAAANAGAANQLAAANAESIPVDLASAQNAATQAALNAAGNANANEAAASATSLANQALDSGVSAANDNLSSAAAESVQSAANDASAGAASSASSAADSLNANNAGNVQAASALLGGQ